MTNLPTDPLEHSRLWEKFREGNTEAFSVIYEHYAADLYRYGYNMVRDKPLIEDALHELFVHLYHNRLNLSSTDNIRFYLFRAFRNRLLNVLEKNKRRETAELSEDSADFIIQPYENEWIEDQTSRQRKQLMLQELNNLPRRQREILYLVYLKGLSHQDTASIMDITVKTVYNGLQVALATLKKYVVVAFEKNGVLGLFMLLGGWFHKL